MSLGDKNRVVKKSNRLIIKRDWQGQNIWIQFVDDKSGITYEYPHDKFIDELGERNPHIFNSDSWNGDQHWYHWPKLTDGKKYYWFRDWLKGYIKTEPKLEKVVRPKSELIHRESDAYLQAVRDWRNYWRPEKINYLLIAESHMCEVDGDTDAEVIPLDEYGLQDHPKSFCRLIHCLGYGEQDLLTLQLESNSGTPQFWDIFGVIACCDVDHPDSTQPRKSESGLDERVKWKVKTLEALKHRGIWLIDASPYAIAGLGRSREGLGNKKEKESFKRIFLEEVLSEIDVGGVHSSWIIGKSVDKEIRDITPSYKGWIYQPQGWRKSQAKYREHLAPMINDICDNKNTTTDSGTEINRRNKSFKKKKADIAKTEIPEVQERELIARLRKFDSQVASKKTNHQRMALTPKAKERFIEIGKSSEAGNRGFSDREIDFRNWIGYNGCLLQSEVDAALFIRRCGLRELASNVLSAFEQGQALTLFVLSRPIIEQVAMIASFLDDFRKIDTEKVINPIFKGSEVVPTVQDLAWSQMKENIVKKLVGKSADVGKLLRLDLKANGDLPWRRKEGFADHKSDGFLNAVDKLGKNVKGVIRLYKLASEFAHPNSALALIYQTEGHRNQYPNEVVQTVDYSIFGSGRLFHSKIVETLEILTSTLEYYLEIEEEISELSRKAQKQSKGWLRETYRLFWKRGVVMIKNNDLCPCLSGKSFGECCGSGL